LLGLFVLLKPVANRSRRYVQNVSPFWVESDRKKQHLSATKAPGAGVPFLAQQDAKNEH